MVVCLIGEDDEIRAMLDQPLVKSFVLQLTAAGLRARAYRHPMGDQWRGIQDIDPRSLSRQTASLRCSRRSNPRPILASVPHGTPAAGGSRRSAALHEAGCRVASILDYSGMAGQAFAARSAAKVRETEDEILRLVGAPP